MSAIRFTLAAVLAASLSAAFSPITSAQDSDQIENAPQSVKPVETRRIVRTAPGQSYWVDADKLSARNNPVAGDVVRVLELGQKVRAYTSFENWIRISPDTKPEIWVNTDFLTTEEISYANYSFSGRTERRRTSRRSKVYDVDLRRIDIEGDAKVNLFAARITELPNQNRVIITKQSFREGPYFEKRLVSCDTSGGATGQQLVAEGHNYVMMERDVRASNVAGLSPASITDDTTQTQSAIAAFACANLPN